MPDVSHLDLRYAFVTVFACAVLLAVALIADQADRLNDPDPEEDE